MNKEHISERETLLRHYSERETLFSVVDNEQIAHWEKSILVFDSSQLTEQIDQLNLLDFIEAGPPQVLRYKIEQYFEREPHTVITDDGTGEPNGNIYITELDIRTEWIYPE